MSVLNEAIGPNEVQVRTTGEAGAATPFHARLDDEIVLVSSLAERIGRARLLRGWFGTTRASHLQGAELVAVPWAERARFLADGRYELVGEGAPTDGPDGTGALVAARGSTYTDLTAGVVYVNAGPAASPNWTASAGPGGGSVTADQQAALDAADPPLDADHPPLTEGGGLPPQWTDGGSGDVTATVDDETTTALTIVKLVDQTADLLSVKDDEGNVLARLRAAASGVSSPNRHFLDLVPQDSLFGTIIRIIAPPGWRADADGAFMRFRDEDGYEVITLGEATLSLLSAADSGQSEIEMRATDAVDDTSAIRSGGAGGDTGESDRLEIVKDGDHVVQVTFAGEVGLFNATPAAQQTLVRPSGDAGDLWDVLAAYGLVKAP